MGRYSKPVLTSLVLIMISITSYESYANEDLIESKEAGVVTPLTKLKNVLQTIKTDAPIAGNLQVSFTDVEEFEGEPKETVGSVGFFISEGKRGLTISYDKEVTSSIKLETAARVLDEEADTPTMDAIREVGTRTINNILSPISSIQTYLTPATLQNTESVEVDGETRQKMYFSMPVESFIRQKEVRKHVDDFDGLLTITIKEDGTPVEMSTTFEGEGRAYLFFKMKAAGSSLNRYEVVDGRLIMTFSERYNQYESTFGNGENSSVLLFSPQTKRKKQDNYLANTSNDTSI